MGANPFARLLCLFALLGVGCSAEPEDDSGAISSSSRTCRLSVRISPRGWPVDVGLAADFADFDASRFPLTRQEDGAFTVTVDAPPGRVIYRVEVDGRPFIDPENPLTLRKDGELFSVRYLDDCSKPALSLNAWAPDRRAVSLTFLPGISGASLKAVAAQVDGQKVAVAVDGDTVTVSWPELSLGKHHLTLQAKDENGVDIEPFVAPFWLESEYFRWEDAVIYQVFLDRFAKDSPFTEADQTASPGDRLGGNLRGLITKLREGYFERLGVNVLWISPLNLNPEGLWPGVEGGEARYSSYHAYWPIAPRKVDPRFGTEAEVEALVAEAHARGIRVLMDVVLNHVHEEHPYARAHLKTWFNPTNCQCGTSTCPWYSHIEVCWFTDYLPDFSWNDPEPLETQVDDALWWIERFDFDGLRVDAVPMMPRFVTRYLTARVHRVLEGLRERHLLIGETFTGPNEQSIIRYYLGPDGLDGQFDFPLMWALRSAFAWEGVPLWDLADAWDESADAWAGSTAVMGLMVGNHDVSRFLSEAANQLDGTREQAWNNRVPIPDDPVAYRRLLLAQAFVLTVPGAPVLYYGDEFGMPGANDPDNRRPMRFGEARTVQEQALATQIERIGRLRRCLPALRRGAMVHLRAEAERLVYLRDLEDGAPAVVVLAREPEDDTVEIHLPDSLAVSGAVMVDALSGLRVRRTDAGLEPFELAPRTPAVLLPEDHPCLDP